MNDPRVARPDLDTSSSPITYKVRFPAPSTHYVEVEAHVPTGGLERVELMLAVWTPGSYLVREYARHVEGLAAHDAGGRPLQVQKTRKNRWRVECAGAEAIVVSYRVYGREMTVRTNFICEEFALLNGAPTFLTVADGRQRPHDVHIELPGCWRESLTELPAADSTPHHYRAADYDALVDAPIVLGNPAVYSFDVGGVSYALANVGEGGIWDGPRSARDLEGIVREQVAFWDGAPYARYLFLNLITEASGGLEHRASTVLMTSRWKSRTRKGYLEWLGLASHELFHAWNVKRLRPVELGPFEYEAENHTRALWIAEGITTYYGDLMVHRAGLSTRREYLDQLSDRIQELQAAPGRLVQTLQDASFDAWIKHYRPDENSANSRISYYTKGAVVAFLLDMEVRRASNGARTLDTVMRAAFEQYGGERGYTEADFRGLVSEIAGADVAPWLARAVETTSELDYAPALDWLGLRFAAAPPKPDGPQKASLGMVTRSDGGRLVVSEVRRDTPAARAGLDVDDEIVAIDGYRLRAEQLDGRMEMYGPGDRVTVLVSRRERLTSLEATLAAEPSPAWRLEEHTNATGEQRSHLAQWLKARP
jgi:predicted metalloprotease with PDZ domain